MFEDVILKATQKNGLKSNLLKTIHGGRFASFYGIVKAPTLLPLLLQLVC